MYVSLFGKRLRKITSELILSAIIVSFVEELALFYTGFLSIDNLSNFLLITGILAVIELVLIFMIEEFLIAAKHTVRRTIIKGRSLRRKTR